MGIKSELVRYTMRAGGVGARMWLACANAIVATFLTAGSVGLYEKGYQMPQFFLEGNTELDADDEEMGGGVEMQLDPIQEEVVEPETPEEVVEEMVPEEVAPEPEPEVVEPVAPENAIFPVPEKEQMIEPLKLEEVKPKPKPKPQPKPQPAPRRRPAATQQATTTGQTGGGGGGAAQGLRTGGAGSKGKFPQPPYPSWARSRGVAGSVTLAVSHDATGTVTSVRVLATCGDSQLDSYTSAFIQRRWRFPAGSPRTHRQQVIYRLRGR